VVAQHHHLGTSMPSGGVHPIIKAQHYPLSKLNPTSPRRALTSANDPKADITKRSGPSCLWEPATYFIVEVPGGPNVPHGRACSRSARQFVPARASLRAADPARWVSGGGQFADQRRAVWSCQSQGPLRPQRHRKCLKSAAAPQQRPGTRGPLNTDGTDTGCHAAFLSERVAADHQPVCHRAAKQGTASPARSPAGQLLHWHLPGLLERFRAKWKPVRVKKTRQNKRIESGSDSIRTE
jgi:hypothetical protein